MAKGKKSCPQCNTSVGVRTKTCKCGHNFTSKTKPKEPQAKIGKVQIDPNNHPVSDELVSTGMWVYDRTEGMKPVRVPPDLPKGPLTNQQIYDAICYDGLGDCLWYYVDANQIQDKKLKEKWKLTRKLMKEIWHYLVKDR